MPCVGPRLCGDTEETRNELHLPYRISAVRPFHLPFPHHVHRFYSLDSSLRRVEGAEALHRSPPLTYSSMVLLDMDEQEENSSSKAIPATAIMRRGLTTLHENGSESRYPVLGHRCG